MHQEDHHKRGRFENLEIYIIIGHLLLVLGIRLYYFTGPIFANTQDEGIYLNLLANAVIRHNYLIFTQYRNVNFSNTNQYMLNPANIPSFYSGLLAPEIFLLTIFNFSSNLAIYYIIFNSLIEALFIYLILREISTMRAAVMATILFAFFPLDVIFSNHIQPLVPAMALITAATYTFIKSEKDTKMKVKTRIIYYIVTGILIGLGYLTNPLSLLLGVFIVLFELFKLSKEINEKSFKSIAIKLAFVFVGFMIAFSITGLYYYAQSGNFFLYPSVDHAGAVNNALTQPKGTVFEVDNINVTRTDVQKLFYLPIIFDLSSYDQYHSSYFSLIGYLGIVFAAVIVFRKVKYGRFFVSMLVLYLVLLNFTPLAFVSIAGKLQIFLVYMEPMLITPLTLPFIAIVALGLEELLSRREKVFMVIALIIILATIIVAVKDLNSDTSYYRSSVASIYSFESFAAQHQNSTFYAYPLIADEINDISSYRYNVRYLLNCSQLYTYETVFKNNTYVFTGGSMGMDVSPGIIRDFSACTQNNISNYSSLAYTANNPFDNMSPVKIYRINYTQ